MMRFGLILTVLGAGLCACARADCPEGDLNSDCIVDATDLRLLAQAWLGDSNTSADLNRDAHVNQSDLAILAGQWDQAGCPVVVNEVLAHAHANAPDWIELHNLSSLAVDIGGWMLSDRKDDLGRFHIAAGTTIDPFGYIVFYESTHFGNPLNPDTWTPFALSENGETVYLYSGEDRVYPGYLAEAQLGPSETFYSFGRYRKSTGQYRYVTLSELSPGARNAYPRVGPVIINEIMYHPASDADAEYVELLNIDEGPVTLYDFAMMEPWRFRDDSGIDFWFPSDNPVTLESGEHLLLVKDAATMHKRYKLPSGVRMMTWGSGKLANQGEHLYLVKPGDVDTAGIRYWIEVDSLEYSDGNHPEAFPKNVDPWPVAADGHGPSLSRLFPHKYGNDPNNWQATIVTPGSTND
ncbi:MAG: lamin tail domain-containing protein [Sedimentisphaerales bacterium]|nr:lamin tail domain-containing protein [Sedimentisphaerales bacterium]